MKRLKLNITACAMFAFALMAGCDSSGNNAVVVVPPPPPPAPTSFNQFVVDQFAATADNTDPVAVDDEDFSFEENPSAFDSVLQ